MARAAIRSFLGPLLAALTMTASPSMAQEPAPVTAPADWGQALAEDAQAFHDLVQANHPGPVDDENPAFNARLEQGLETARARARTADSYEDWYFALREYSASFDDGHLSLSDWARMDHVWTADWPGFLTGLRGETHEVVFNRDPAAPPVGARLVSCDDRPADAFAAEYIGRSAGRWMLRSRRESYAGSLFVDQKNPYVTRPESCVFAVDGATRTYALTWRPLPDAVRDEGFAQAASPRHFAPVELRAWPRGFWISLGNFESDPNTDDGRRLQALVEEIAARADDIRPAPVVVFDLRGNNGGSSLWSSAIARALWGEAWVEAVDSGTTSVDWRASPANLATMEHYRDFVLTEGEAHDWAAKVAAGMAEALAHRAPLWVNAGDEDETPPAPPEGPSPMKARAYVLTDYGCASACLDAADVFLALGAVQIGQETSADTVYMDMRSDPLPSGRAEANVPMKVYRGRARGNNQSLVPAHAWTGALDDTAGIEAWLVGIDAGR